MRSRSLAEENPTDPGPLPERTLPAPDTDDPAALILAKVGILSSFMSVEAPKREWEYFWALPNRAAEEF